MADRRQKDDLREAINRLEQVIAQHVRREQQADQLTRLKNGLALTEALGEAVAGGADFWIAFVEIDRFKSLNDRFGHESADAVLLQVAQLMEAMTACFPGKTSTYRAHGDEFYYLGLGGDADVAVGLDALRQAVAAIKIETDIGNDALMTCTVSVGWLSKADLADLADLVTVRRVHDALELAVAKAKRTRDSVVRFAKELKQEDWISLRADCGSCESRFAFDMKRAAARADQAWCPNCGSRVERPAAPPPRSSGPIHPI